jgi:hypothetical protein
MLIAAAACGGRATVAPSPTGPPAVVEPPTHVPPTAPPASGRDFRSLNLCELVTQEEVAALAGGTVYRPSNQSSDPTFAHCWHEVEFADGGYEYYIVYVEAVELAEAALSLGDGGDPLPGLGDEAYLKFEDTGQQYRLIVLVHGDYAIDMAGSRSEVMVEIARLLIERLGS